MFTKPSCGLAAVLLVATCAPAWGQEVGCVPPIPPFVPSDPADVLTYADLLRQDFETYIEQFEDYLRCLDTERARAFQEGQAVVREYARFQDLVRGSGSPAPAEPFE